jgi:hypothetical protein
MGRHRVGVNDVLDRVTPVTNDLFVLTVWITGQNTGENRKLGRK